MPRAKPENCTHPRDKKERTALYRYHCGRCGTDLTNPAYLFEYRHSPRVMLTHGDRVAVNSQHVAGPFQGIFLYAEELKQGIHYTIAETQTYKDGKNLTREGWAAIRTVHSDFVRQAAGVRDRKARAMEEVIA